MTDKITREIFDHMALLAALELNDKEAEYLREQLNNQLSAVDELVSIPLQEDLSPASHGVPFSIDKSSGLREDVHSPFLNSDKILDYAPEVDDGHFVVPNIPHEDLE